MSGRTNSLSQLALRKFKKNFWGVFSFWFIVLVGLVSIFAYVIAPDNSQNANQMHLSIHSKKPGFTVKMLTIPNTLNSNPQSWFNKVFFGEKNPQTEIPIVDYKVENNNLTYTEYASDDLKGITKTIATNFLEREDINNYIKEKTFLLGTDKYGRDLLSRILAGARISFFIGFIAVFISLVIGIFFGSIAGYFGGKIDTFIMWLINVTWSIPTLLLVIAITLALGKGFLASFYCSWINNVGGSCPSGQRPNNKCKGDAICYCRKSFGI